MEVEYNPSVLIFQEQQERVDILDLVATPVRNGTELNKEERREHPEA